MPKPSRVTQLKAQGFDESQYVGGRAKYVRVRCSQCEALVINGYPTHERGCPNTLRTCRECGNHVPRDSACCDA